MAETQIIKLQFDTKEQILRIYTSTSILANWQKENDKIFFLTLTAAQEADMFVHKHSLV